MRTKFSLVLAVLLFLAGLWFLADNAKAADAQMNQILAKDQAGQPVQNDIANLESYAHNHMHASVSFELTGSYQRAAAGQTSVPSPQLGQQAQAACASRADSITQANCVRDYLAKHQPAATPAASAPDPSKFSYNFHSPAWAPDKAGLTLLAAAICLCLAIYWRLTRPRRLY